MRDFPELKFSVVNGYCDIILLPFQGVYFYCNHYYPKVSLRLPLGYVRFAFALSGRLLLIGIVVIIAG